MGVEIMESYEGFAFILLWCPLRYMNTLNVTTSKMSPSNVINVWEQYGLLESRVQICCCIRATGMCNGLLCYCTQILYKSYTTVKPLYYQLVGISWEKVVLRFYW